MEYSEELHCILDPRLDKLTNFVSKWSERISENISKIYAVYMALHFYLQKLLESRFHVLQ